MRMPHQPTATFSPSLARPRRRRRRPFLFTLPTHDPLVLSPSCSFAALLPALLPYLPFPPFATLDSNYYIPFFLPLSFFLCLCAPFSSSVSPVSTKYSSASSSSSFPLAVSLVSFLLKLRPFPVSSVSHRRRAARRASIIFARYITARP